MILLSNTDLSIAAAMVVMLALLSLRLQAGISGQLLIAALRTAVQLTLIGLVLKTLFANVHLGWITLLALFMLLVAGREVMARQERRFAGWWGFAALNAADFKLKHNGKEKDVELGAVIWVKFHNWQNR